ncbi:hypothetical protein P7K49_034029 [Saguinus oedipus]|uniref:Uncharacterized protein n=1 Tax=Saguinus oedipus TaxID=9490 RepID=A0ABQ9TTL3_SAGOE|nr:hypothetical protein P7K49_034029 [Saguinus oedipus]
MLSDHCQDSLVLSSRDDLAATLSRILRVLQLLICHPQADGLMLNPKCTERSPTLPSSLLELPSQLLGSGWPGLALLLNLFSPFTYGCLPLPGWSASQHFMPPALPSSVSLLKPGMPFLTTAPDSAQVSPVLPALPARGPATHSHASICSREVGVSH